MEGSRRVDGEFEEGSWKPPVRTDATLLTKSNSRAYLRKKPMRRFMWRAHGRPMEGSWKAHGRPMEGARKVHGRRAYLRKKPMRSWPTLSVFGGGMLAIASLTASTSGWK